MTSPDGLRSYFHAAFGAGPHATINDPVVAVLSDTSVVVTGLDDVNGNIGRVTFVVLKTDSGWKIMHFHRSKQP